ncbi:MAG: hypothetical protein WD552_02510 [Candidatus Paceibacterota bacterium]
MEDQERTLMKTSWYMPLEAIATCLVISFFGWLYIPQIIGINLTGQVFILTTIITTIVLIIAFRQIMELRCRYQENSKGHNY